MSKQPPNRRRIVYTCLLDVCAKAMGSYESSEKWKPLGPRLRRYVVAMGTSAADGGRASSETP